MEGTLKLIWILILKLRTGFPATEKNVWLTKLSLHDYVQTILTRAAPKFWCFQCPFAPEPLDPSLPASLLLIVLPSLSPDCPGSWSVKDSIGGQRTYLSCWTLYHQCLKQRLGTLWALKTHLGHINKLKLGWEVPRIKYFLWQKWERALRTGGIPNYYAHVFGTACMKTLKRKRQDTEKTEKAKYL